MSNKDQNSVKPTADGIAAAANRAIKSKGPAPVHLWNPPFCGDLDMRIARDGTWFYMGTPIGRKPLVKLFSSILRKDDEKYFLVTPVEKVGITVDDAPFVAVDYTVLGLGKQQAVTFTTQVDEKVTAGPKNPMRFDICDKTGEPSPYVLVRNNLEALIDRKSFYRLVDLGENYNIGDESWFGIWSGGEFYKMALSKTIGF